MLGAVERSKRRLEWWTKNFGGEGGKFSSGEKIKRASDVKALEILAKRLKAAAKTAPRDGTEELALMRLPRGGNAYHYKF